jgi:hypothetical protein
VILCFLYPFLPESEKPKQPVKHDFYELNLCGQHIVKAIFDRVAHALRSRLFGEAEQSRTVAGFAGENVLSRAKRDAT